jgi:hypothetical protein
MTSFRKDLLLYFQFVFVIFQDVICQDRFPFKSAGAEGAMKSEILVDPFDVSIQCAFYGKALIALVALVVLRLEMDANQMPFQYEPLSKGHVTMGANVRPDVFVNSFEVTFQSAFQGEALRTLSALVWFHLLGTLDEA